MMHTSGTQTVHEGRLNGSHPVTPSEMSLVDIAKELEDVTRRIEAERVREREARKAYKVVADEVDAKVQEIRSRAKALLDEQNKRHASFEGMFRKSAPFDPLHSGKPSNGNGFHAPPRSAAAGRLSMADAILKIWTLDEYSHPLSTEEIAEALHVVGYTTRAAPRSFKSSLNQTLAKLCRDQLVRRYRSDGTEIDHSDNFSRARRYMAIRNASRRTTSPSSN